MSSILCVLRLVFGLFWLVFGLNYFLHLFPVPTATGDAATLMQGLEASGYMMPLIYAVQILSGALLLANRFVPLALLLLAPITANILLYDLLLNPGGLVIGAVIAALHATLLYTRRRAYMGLLTIK